MVRLKAILLLALATCAQAQEPIFPAGSLRGPSLTSPREAPQAVSLDGQTLILNGSAAVQLAVIDANSGQELYTVNAGRHPHKKLHLLPGDQMLIAVNHDQLFIVNLKTSQVQALCPTPEEILKGAQLVSFAVSDNGSTLVTLSRTKALDDTPFLLRVWNPATGEVLGTASYPVKSWTEEPLLTLSPQGNRLAIYPRNINLSPTMVTPVQMWEIESITPKERRFVQGKNVEIVGVRISQIAFHPRQRQLVLAAIEFFDHRRLIPPRGSDGSRLTPFVPEKEPDGLLIVYDFDEHKELSRRTTELINPMSHLCFSADGMLLAGWDMGLSQAMVWETQHWQARLVVKNDYKSRPWPHIHRMRFLNNDQVHLDVNSMNMAGRWVVDLQQPGQLKLPKLPVFQVARSHSSDITSFGFSDDQKLLYSADQHGLVCTWDISQQSLVESFQYPYLEKTFQVSRGGMMLNNRWSRLQPTLSPRGKFLIRNDISTPSLILSTQATGEQRNLRIEVEEKPNMDIPLNAAFSPDETKVLTDWFEKGTRFVQVWETATGKSMWQRKDLPPGDNQRQALRTSLSFSKDGRSVVQSGLRLDASNGNNLPVEQSTSLYTEPARKPPMVLNESKQQQYLGQQFLPDGRSFLAMTRYWQANGSLYEMHWVERYTRETRLIYALPDRSQLWLWKLNPSGDACFASTGQRAIYFWKLIPDQQSKDQLSVKELETHWQTLKKLPAQPAWQAMQRFISDPARAVPFLAERLKPHPYLDRIPELAAQLDSADFQKREEATQALRSVGPAARSALEKAKQSDSPEQARRAGQLLQSLGNLDLETLYTLRVLEVLERIGNAAACQVLEQFVKQSPEGVLRDEAKASLGRIQR